MKVHLTILAVAVISFLFLEETCNWERRFGVQVVIVGQFGIESHVPWVSSLSENPGHEFYNCPFGTLILFSYQSKSQWKNLVWFPSISPRFPVNVQITTESPQIEVCVDCSWERSSVILTAWIFASRLLFWSVPRCKTCLGEQLWTLNSGWVQNNYQDFVWASARENSVWFVAEANVIKFKLVSQPVQNSSIPCPCPSYW